MFNDLFFRARVAKNDHGLHLFIAERGGQADDNCFLYFRVTLEQFLDLARIDLISPFIDEELLSSNQIEQTILISPPEISGEKIAVAKGIVLEIIGPVALDRRRALNGDFSDFIGLRPF